MTLRDAKVYGPRGRVGLIVPPTNTANEAEWMRLLPEGVTLHTTRMPLHDSVGSEAGFAALVADLRRTLPLLTAAKVDVIAYGCTAGSLVLPPARLIDAMQRIAGVPCVATAPALVEQCAALGVMRVALATPYHDTLNEHEAAFLRGMGLEVVAVRGLGLGRWRSRVRRHRAPQG